MSKQIILKSLNLRNFKGIKDLSINFDKNTNIYGENATGKTTIADAFTWLLFDKDSQDRAAFEIKTLDINNNVIHGLEHEVSGVLNIDGRDTVLSKIYKEKWTKKRGEANKELTGHETLYYIDDVPVKKSEFQEKISSFINEQIFKLITNPLYFSTNMKWQDRRKVLLDIIGDVNAGSVINYNSQLKGIEALLVDKDIDTLKKSISARKQKLNNDIKSIPYRIDELNNSIKELDFNDLESQKGSIISEIKFVEDKLLDSSKVNEEVLNERNRLYELKSKLRNIEFRAKEEAERPLANLKREVTIQKNDITYKIETEIIKLENSIRYNNNSLIDYEKSLTELRNEWGEVNQEVLEIDPSKFICPTCKRTFEERDIEAKTIEMQENFNQSKAKKLSAINSKGKDIKTKSEKLEIEIKEEEKLLSALYDELDIKKKEVAELELKISNYQPLLNLESNQEYQNTLKEVQDLEDKLQQQQENNNQISELRSKKLQLERQLESINKDLNYKEININTKARITELQEEERKLAQQIAELEGQEFLCEEFIKTKVELLESSINNRFKYVSFKLFDTQVNGGIVECCEALINGVPFSNANTASQINAGLDIINALSEHYGVSAPIFIDNRESVNQILDCNSQVINLIVSQDKTLRIENNESEVA